MRSLTRLSLLAFLVLLILFPFFFGQFMAASLAKLQLSPAAAVVLVIGIFAGSLINIPVARIARTEDVGAHPLATFGLEQLFPQLSRVGRETVIAVNLGGCVIPAALALYELVYLAAQGPGILLAVVVASGVNVTVCYFLARPVRGLGIVMPGLVPAVVAALLAWILAPAHAAPVAFVTGVSGPLLGADLLHLKDMSKLATAVASIGGAGTFDGIVLSGMVALYLA